MNFDIIIQAWPQLASGLGMTLLLSIAAIVGSTVLGLVAAIARWSRVPIVSQLARLYVEILRGAPVLIILLVVYFGAAYAGFHMDLLAAAIIGLSVYHGAYVAELFRSGIEAVPRGQWEASSILGISTAQTYASVILPQTGRVVLPPLVGQYISLIKDTPIAFVIGLAELVRQSQSIVDRVGQPATVYFVVAAIYFVICYPLSRWVRELEKRSAPA